MLDQLGNYVVQRISSRHLNAVSKLGDLAALLAGYASLGHKTIIVPELLDAASEQVRLAGGTTAKGRGPADKALRAKHGLPITSRCCDTLRMSAAPPIM